jgi:hypothetical protein
MRWQSCRLTSALSEPTSAERHADVAACCRAALQGAWPRARRPGRMKLLACSSGPAVAVIAVHGAPPAWLQMVCCRALGPSVGTRVPSRGCQCSAAGGRAGTGAGRLMQDWRERF